MQMAASHHSHSRQSGFPAAREILQSTAQDRRNFASSINAKVDFSDLPSKHKAALELFN